MVDNMIHNPEDTCTMCGARAYDQRYFCSECWGIVLSEDFKRRCGGLVKTARALRKDAKAIYRRYQAGQSFMEEMRSGQ